MAYLKTVTHAILFILGIWALGQVFYRRAPVDIRAEQSHAVEADKNARAHTAEIGLCFIVRTYWAHGANEGSSPLTAMLQSFIQSNHKKWEALILVMDKKPFTNLAEIVSGLGDPRVRIWAEKVGEAYAAKLPDGTWNPKYHDDLYMLTDQAIKACSSDTTYFVVTNGDNEYDQQFIPRLVGAPPDADIIALDFYSRYQRVTAKPCDRFAALPEAPPCKENLLRFCNTDLASVAYRWSRFVAEDRAFSKMESHGIGLNDGLLARLLKSSAWKTHRISDACLLSHSPSPQLCALHDGVWDDSVYSLIQHSGGRCLDKEEAENVLFNGGHDLEMVEVSVSHDGSTFGFKQGKPVKLQCIRKVLPPGSAWVNQFYPEQCAALMDGGIDY